jgi:hypothetical protein
LAVFPRSHESLWWREKASKFSWEFAMAKGWDVGLTVQMTPGDSR